MIEHCLTATCPETLTEYPKTPSPSKEPLLTGWLIYFGFRSIHTPMTGCQNYSNEADRLTKTLLLNKDNRLASNLIQLKKTPVTYMECTRNSTFQRWQVDKTNCRICNCTKREWRCRSSTYLRRVLRFPEIGRSSSILRFHNSVSIWLDRTWYLISNTDRLYVPPC